MTATRQTRITSRVRGSIVVQDVVDDMSRWRIGRNEVGRWDVDERRGAEWFSLEGSFRTLREARAAVDDYVNGADWLAA